MKPALTALALAALAHSAFAQSAADPNEGLALQVVPAMPGGFSIHFFGKGGRTYFLQRSTDLTAQWEYFPIIETGADAPVAYGFTTDSPRIFVRLRIVEQTFADPYALDPDTDGLTNQEEFDARSDPFDSDTDDDLLPDKWEVDHALDPRASDAAGDADGDGRSNLQEYQLGSDPQDYYNGSVPTIATLEGAGQAGPPGYFLPKPWTVQVRNAAGVLLANAPVTFTVPAGQGGLSAAPSGSADPLPATLTVRTDALGLAWVYWKL